MSERTCECAGMIVSSSVDMRRGECVSLSLTTSTADCWP